MADLTLPPIVSTEEFFRQFLSKMRKIPNISDKVRFIRLFADTPRRYNPFSSSVKSVFIDEGQLLKISDVRALIEAKYYFTLYWAIRYKKYFNEEARKVSENLQDAIKFEVLLFRVFVYYDDNILNGDASIHFPLENVFVSEISEIGISEKYLRAVIAGWSKIIDKIAVRRIKKSQHGFARFLRELQLGKLGEKIRKKLIAYLGMAAFKAARSKVPHDNSLFSLITRLYCHPSEWHTPQAEALRMRLRDELSLVMVLNKKQHAYIKSLSKGAFPVVVSDIAIAKEMVAFASWMLENYTVIDSADKNNDKNALKKRKPRDYILSWFKQCTIYDIRSWLEDRKNPQTSDPVLLKCAIHFLFRKSFLSLKEKIGYKVSPFIIIKEAINTVEFVIELCLDQINDMTIVQQAWEMENGIVGRHFRNLLDECYYKILIRSPLSEIANKLAGIREILLKSSLIAPLNEMLEHMIDLLEKRVLGLLKSLVRVLTAHLQNISSIAYPTLPHGYPVPHLFFAEDFISLLDRAILPVLRAWRERRRKLPVEGLLVPVLSRMLTTHGFLGLSLKETPKGELQCRWFLRGGASFAMRFDPEKLGCFERTDAQDILADILALYALTAGVDACNKFFPLRRYAKSAKKIQEIEYTVDITALPVLETVSRPGDLHMDIKITTRYPKSLFSHTKSSGSASHECPEKSLLTRHTVTGHLRNLLPGQSPSPRAAENALIYGGWPYLPPRRTFVKPHMRGGVTERDKTKIFVPTIHSAAFAVSLDAVAVDAALKSGTDLRALGFEPAKTPPGSRLRTAMKFTIDPLRATEFLRCEV